MQIEAKKIRTCLTEGVTWELYALPYKGVGFFEKAKYFLLTPSLEKEKYKEVKDFTSEVNLYEALK